MNFSFITSGEHWQQFVGRLLREELGSEYEPVSSLRKGDLGIDGYVLKTRTVFQMYFPQPEPGVSSIEKVRRKLRDTTKKLQRNADQLTDILATAPDKLVLVVPEDPPVDFLEKIRTSSPPVEIWGETVVAALVSKHYRAVKDLLSLFSIPGEDDLSAVLAEGRRALRSGDLNRAKQSFEDALKAALLKGNATSRAEAELGLSALAMEVGDYRLAEATAARAQTIAPTSMDVQTTALMLRARIAEVNGELLQAETFLDAAELANGSIDPDFRYEVVVSRARIALAKNELTAVPAFLAQLDGFPDPIRGRLAIELLHLKARHARMSGQSDDEVRLLTAALEKALADDDLARAGDMAVELAVCLSGLGLERAAREHLSDAVTNFRRAKLSRDAIHAEILLGKLYLKGGMLDEAASTLEQAYKEIKADPETFEGLLADTTFLLSGLAARNQAWDLAIQYAAEAGTDLQLRKRFDGQFQVLKTMMEIDANAGREATAALSFSRKIRKALEDQNISCSPSLRYLILETSARLEFSTGNYEAATALLQALDPGTLPPENRKRATDARRQNETLIAEQANVSSLVADLGQIAASSLAGLIPDGMERLVDAHQVALSELLPWVEAWPEFRPEIYDFWARGSFVRLLLHHRAASPRYQLLEPAFVLSVEVATIDEARMACRVFLPIVDSLVLLWKGPLTEGITLLPVPLDYAGPGGWGYLPTSGLFPPRDGPVGACCAAGGYGLFLPDDLCRFYFEEAAWFVKRGRLLLFPAALVGSAFSTHGFLEKLLLQNLLDAVPVILDLGVATLGMVSPLPLVVPYFPRISMQDLALVCEDEEDRFRLARRVCMSWGREIGSDRELTSIDLVRINDELKLGFTQLNAGLQTVTGKLSSSALGPVTGSEISSGVIVDRAVHRPRLDDNDVAATGLWNALGGRGKAAYPYWKSSSLTGGRWNIAGPHLPRPIPRESATFRLPFDHVTGRPVHWFYPPRLGWTIIESSE